MRKKAELATKLLFLNEGDYFYFEGTQDNYRNLQVARVTESGALIRGDAKQKADDGTETWVPLPKGYVVSAGTPVFFIKHGTVHVKKKKNIK